jgi:hypothetical protein
MRRTKNMPKLTDDKKRVITKKVRLSYAYLWEPRTDDKGKASYSTGIIIPKSDTETLAAIDAAVKAAYEDGATILRGKGRTTPKLESVTLPLHDGDERENDDDGAYANSFYLTAKSYKYQPKMYDRTRPGEPVQEITDENRIYSGVYVRADLSFFAYNKDGNKGIACGLNSIKFVADGTRLGGVTRSADVFADDYDEILGAEADDEDFLS